MIMYKLAFDTEYFIKKDAVELLLIGGGKETLCYLWPFDWYEQALQDHNYLFDSHLQILCVRVSRKKRAGNFIPTWNTTLRPWLLQPGGSLAEGVCNPASTNTSWWQALVLSFDFGESKIESSVCVDITVLLWPKLHLKPFSQFTRCQVKNVKSAIVRWLHMKSLKIRKPNSILELACILSTWTTSFQSLTNRPQEYGYFWDRYKALFDQLVS